MRYLIAILILLGVVGVARAVRFDWTNGTPSVVEDITTSSTDDDTRYDWTNGKPAVVLDGTFVAASGADASAPVQVKVENGQVIIQDGQMVILD